MITERIPPMFSLIQMNFGSSGLSVSQADAAATSASFDVVDLACRLSKLSTFLPAAHELLSVLFKSKYKITTRKIIRLIELARKTLERAGIVLYSFASCPEAFVMHKEAYIDLLKFLRSSNRQGSTELRGRIQILLMPLTSNFSVQKKINSLYIHSTSPQRYLRTTSASSCSGEGTQSPSYSPSAAQPITMLPPDAFPVIFRPSGPSPNSPIERRRLPLWDYRQFEKSSTSKRRLNQENIIAQAGKYRPPKKLRQFGIYCTRRSSMDNLSSFRRNERQIFVL